LPRKADGCALVIAPFTFVRPCAPALKRTPPDGPEWAHEIKWDGWRLQAHKGGDAICLMSRSGKDITRRFPLIAEAMLAFPAREVILDGELISINEAGELDFHALRSRWPDAAAIIFDVLFYNGKDLRPQPWFKRRAQLEKIMARNKSPLLQISDVWNEGDKVLQVAAESRLEGIVSKYRNAPYRSGPTDAWQKVKVPGWESFRR
jgi:bifunctional non-homologous end joining protein LigD